MKAGKQRVVIINRKAKGVTCFEGWCYSSCLSCTGWFSFRKPVAGSAWPHSYVGSGCCWRCLRNFGNYRKRAVGSCKTAVVKKGFPLLLRRMDESPARSTVRRQEQPSKSVSKSQQSSFSQVDAYITSFCFLCWLFELQSPGESNLSFSFLHGWCVWYSFLKTLNIL